MKQLQKQFLRQMQEYNRKFGSDGEMEEYWPSNIDI